MSMTYRVAKGAASLLLLLLAAVGTLTAITGFSLVAVVVWAALTVAIIRLYRARTAEAEPAAGE